MQQSKMLFVIVGVAIIGVAIISFLAFGREGMERNMKSPVAQESMEKSAPAMPPSAVPAPSAPIPNTQMRESIMTDKSQTVSTDTSLDSIEKELGSTNIAEEDFSDL
jgi:hypothetical protein